ncbi:MAG: citramalate synthase [Christensenellales bacterium]
MKIELYDTTLRDGAGGLGISYSTQDKTEIFKLLDDYGIDLIEGGYPSANPKDTAFFETENSDKLVAFCSTCKAGIEANSDSCLKNTLKLAKKTVCIFGKTSKVAAEKILKTTAENNLKMIYDSVKLFTDNKKRVIFDAEHFFDNYNSDRDYAVKALKAAADAGADTLVLCDSNGGTFPSVIGNVTKEIVSLFPQCKIGIHAHNDVGMAVACSIMAVENGASHIQGTFLGFGERSGNANLAIIIANLKLKTDYEVDVKLIDTTKTGRKIAEISNITLDNSMPYIGKSAFSHKAGTHADAAAKGMPFEHIKPELVGNTTDVLLSEFSGKALVIEKLKSLFPSFDEDKITAKDLLKSLKNLELEGYQFEGADGSFKILAKKLGGKFTPSFEILDYNFTSHKQEQGDTGLSKAIITINANGKTVTVEKDGNGPVNALDSALRFALVSQFPKLKDVTLIDYKVRVIDSKRATGATVRVLITSTDGASTWTTVGVSTDILEASLTALCDSFEYKLSFLD